MKLVFVTGNKLKFEDTSEILRKHGIELEHVSLELPEPQADPEEIARHKAKFAAEELKKPCFVDDTALCFNALNGLPGEYIKYFITKLGPQNVVKLLEGFEDKSAKAMLVIAYCEPGKEPVVFEGAVNGTIVPPRGERFAWDPIFMPEGHEKTYAEMSVEEKGKISHRKIAIDKFIEYLKNDRERSEDNSV